MKFSIDDDTLHLISWECSFAIPASLPFFPGQNRPTLPISIFGEEGSICRTYSWAALDDPIGAMIFFPNGWGIEFVYSGTIRENFIDMEMYRSSIRGCIKSSTPVFDIDRRFPAFVRELAGRGI